MKRILVVMSICAALAFGVSAAMAADGAALYKSCVGCHGADGSKTAQSKALKGMGADAFTKAMDGYKAKKYGGAKKAVMEGQAAALSADDIKALAAYVAKF